jgi:hypothetical protein
MTNGSNVLWFVATVHVAVKIVFPRTTTGCDVSTTGTPPTGAGEDVAVTVTGEVETCARSGSAKRKSAAGFTLLAMALAPPLPVA